MKKTTTLILVFLAHFSIAQQIYTTGDVNFNTKFTARIDMTSEKVTLTTITPSNVWYSIGFGVKRMNENGDTFLSNGDQVVDAICTGYSTPRADSQQDWTLVSNDVSNGKRTMVVTRPLKTTDNSDYVFNPKASSLTLMWAVGDGKAYRRHSRGNYGATVAGVTLSNDDFYARQFKISPNPVSDSFTLELPSGAAESHVTVFDLSGKKVYASVVAKSYATIDTSHWVKGVYLMRIKTEDGYTVTKKVIKS